VHTILFFHCFAKRIYHEENHILDQDNHPNQV
jgi:hypothetical protein